MRVDAGVGGEKVEAPYKEQYSVNNEGGVISWSPSDLLELDQRGLRMVIVIVG